MWPPGFTLQESVGKISEQDRRTLSAVIKVSSEIEFFTEFTVESWTLTSVSRSIAVASKARRRLVTSFLSTIETSASATPAVVATLFTYADSFCRPQVAVRPQSADSRGFFAETNKGPTGTFVRYGSGTHLGSEFREGQIEPYREGNGLQTRCRRELSILGRQDFGDSLSHASRLDLERGAHSLSSSHPCAPCS